MTGKLRFSKTGLSERIVFAWTLLIISFFTLIVVIIFPLNIFGNAPESHIIEGVNGYVALTGDSGKNDGEIFMLRGEWEFYPNQLYYFDDFTNGRTGETRISEFPHYWKNEPDEIIRNTGYSTYRMRVRVPVSVSGIGIYSRYQYSAYEIYLNDTYICGAGVVSKNIDEHETVYLPTNGYTFSAIGTEGRTFSVILHVQNEVSDLGGLANDIFIGSAKSVQNLRTLLLMVNGFISGGLLLLFICFFLIYLNGRERKEYLDYTIVSLVVLFISLTSGGESLMYSTGIDSILLARLEYCAIITGAFFANHSILKRFIKSKAVFRTIYIYITLANAFYLSAPMMIFSILKMPVIVISVAFFIIPLAGSIRDIVKKHDFIVATSLISYVIVFIGMYFYITGNMPWDSVDIFSLSIMMHCILQMVIFLHKYRKTEETLKNMTETLEERIIDRTIQLTQMKEKAEAAAITKSNFLANMSHEIRTPMNAIMGISDLIRTDNLDESQINYLTDIKKSSKALLQIINDILDFSKIEAGKLEIIPEHFSLMSVYDNICSICRYSANTKNLKFTHSFAPDVPKYIIGDEVRYRQIILNILNNAIKYTREGSVDFKIEKTEMCGVPFLTFTVKDTGIGIKSEDFSKMFNSFQQLDSNSNRKIVGTGLGLSISKQLISLMDGDIDVESEYGKGTTFKVFLPLVEGDREKINAPEDYIRIMTKDAKVLVVDDNQINLTVAEGFLSLHGIKPDTALNGLEAIEKIKNNKYDLVFMDHMMPEMDGVKATNIIRSMENERFADLPIIALTANAVTGARNIFKQAGMDDFLSKPIEAARINAILTRWLPKEKLSGTEAQTETVSANDDIDRVFYKLNQINGLNTISGISNSADNKFVYLKIIKQFCNEFDKYEADIFKSLEAEEWADYTVKLHAMKGVFANLGAFEISERAHKLEDASRNKEYLICKDETDEFCKNMRALYDKLAASIPANTDVRKSAEKSAISVSELKVKLKELSMSCKLGDSDAAEEIQRELSGRNFSDEIDAELTEIYNLIGSFDFDIVINKIEEIFKVIN